MLQNHVTEIMTLLTMKLPSNLSSSEDVAHNKLQLLNTVLPLAKDQAVLGQYQGYKTQVQQELNRTKDHVSVTPTFAGESPTPFTSPGSSGSDLCPLSSVCFSGAGAHR